MILTPAQAEAVCAAMAALNNVGGNISHIDFGAIEVNADSGVIVTERDRPLGPAIVGSECYDSQAAFAAAYGLTQG